MANVYMDSFGHTSGFTYSGSCTFGGDIGRRGLGAAYISTTAAGAATRSISISGDTVICGFAIRIEGDSLSTQKQIFYIGEGSNTHIIFCVNPDRTISARYQSLSGTVLGTSSRVIVMNEWMYVELKVKVHPTAGSVDVRMNGVNQISVGGIGTRSTTSTSNTVNFIGLFGGGSTWSAHYYDKAICDLYVNDTSGTSMNDFLGVVRVEYLQAAADGSYEELTSSTGTTNQYSNVGDTSASSDSAYLYASVGGKRSSFTVRALPAITGGSVIYAVKPYFYGGKTDAGFLDMALFIREGLTATDLDLQTFQPTQTLTAYRSDSLATNPFTSIGWTGTDLTNLQVGVKTVAV